MSVSQFITFSIGLIHCVFSGLFGCLNYILTHILQSNSINNNFLKITCYLDFIYITTL